MADLNTPEIKIISIPNSSSQYIIFNDYKHRLVHDGKKKQTWQCAVEGCKHTIYTKNCQFAGIGTKQNSSTHQWGFAHHKWTSKDQNRNDLLIEMINDISLNNKPVHKVFDKVCVDNPEASTSIGLFEEVRKTLYRAKKKSGGLPLPVSGSQANQLLSKSKYSRNYYGQHVVLNAEEKSHLNDFDDVDALNDRLKAISLEQSKLKAEKQRLLNVKSLKFNGFAVRDSLLFLGGSDDGMYQVFCERDSANILLRANALLFDGSWGSTPMMSIKCKKRNHYRMEWSIIACFQSMNEEEVPLTVKCASILFAKDKPSGALYEETLRYLQKRCVEEFECDIFEFQQIDGMILGMADYEKPMRNNCCDKENKIGWLLVSFFTMFSWSHR